MQRLVRDKLLEAFPDVSPDDVKSCPSGSNGADIILSAAAKEAIPYSIECKARSKIALVYEALAQAERKDGLTPVAIIKADRKRPLAVIDLETFITLIS